MRLGTIGPLPLLLVALAACGSGDGADRSAAGAGQRDGEPGMVPLRLEGEGSSCRPVGGGADGAALRLRCGGPGGYAVQIGEVDGHATLAVVDPDGAEHAVDVAAATAHAGASRIGDTAEWHVVRRGRRTVATALVVTHVAVRPDGPRNSAGERLDLLVVKLGDEVCVTDRVPAASAARAESRRLAETAGTRPCLGAA